MYVYMYVFPIHTPLEYNSFLVFTDEYETEKRVYL